MDNFITLTCPTRGGKLQITSDIERFAWLVPDWRVIPPDF